MKKYLLLAILVLSTACTVVSPTERAVRYNFGALSDDVLQPGTHVWIPYVAGSKTIDLRIQKLEIHTSSGTKDQQEVGTSVTLNIQVDAAKVVELVKKFGSEENAIDQIIPMVKEAVNGQVSKYSAKEVLTKRAELKAGIEQEAKDELLKYGIILHTVSVTDLQYSKEYSDAIEQAQIAEQKAKQAEYKTVQVENEAKAAIAKARGEAEANRMKQQTITPLLVQLEAVQKWNGVVPQFMGSGSLPFMLNFNGSK